MLAFIGPLGGPEIAVILVIVLLLFGAKRLPELARSLGQGVKEFRKSVKEIGEDADDGDSGPPAKQP
jgi:sec-independent protein translocase protein TatA